MARSLLILAAMLFVTCSGLLVRSADPVGAGRLLPASNSAGEADEASPRNADQPILAAIRSEAAAGERVSQIRPVDPVTLEPLAGFEPVEVEGLFTYAFSAAGARVAILAWPEQPFGAEPAGSLRIVDLEQWTVEEVPHEIWSDSGQPVFAGEGPALYWFDRVRGTPVNDVLYVLHGYQTGSGRVEPVVELPTDLIPLEVLADNARSQLAVIAARQDQAQARFTEGDAQLLLIDLSSGSITATLPLEGVVAGSLWEEGAGDDGWPVQIHRPGVALDGANGLLYVTHTSGDALTVVDLAAGSVQSVIDLKPDKALFDRLLGWLFPEAAAIARSVTNGHIIVSSDGARLYSATTHERMAGDRRETEQFTATPLSILDLRSGETIRVDLGGVQRMALTADGKRLLVATYPHIFPVAEGEHRLHLLDPITGEIEQQIEIAGPPGHAQIEGPLLVGSRYAYVSYFGDSGLEWMVVDPATLDVVTSRPAGEMHKLLVPPTT